MKKVRLLVFSYIFFTAFKTCLTTFKLCDDSDIS